MRKSFSRVMSLILVIALTMSFTSFTTVLAAGSVPGNSIFDISEGNITIVDSGTGYQVTYGKGLTAHVKAKTTPITITGGTFAAPTTNGITVTRGSNLEPLNLRLSAVFVNTTPAARTVNNKPALNIAGNAPTNITLVGDNTLLGNGNGAAIAGSTSALSFSAVPATSTLTASTILGKSVTVNSGAVTTGFTGNGAVAVKGGTLTTTGNVTGPVALTSGTYNVTSGTVASLTTTGGIANINGGIITNLTVGGGTVNANGTSSISKATLTNGTLKIAGTANLTSLTKNGGTYIDNHFTTDGSPLVQKTFTGLTGRASATLSFEGGVTKTHQVTNGTFQAYVPDAAITFSVITNDNKHFTATGVKGNNTVALSESTTPPPPTTPTVSLSAANVKYKQDIVINYTCSDDNSNAFASAAKTVKLGADTLTLNAKNGYTITPKTATTGIITIKGAANKKVTDKIAITVTPTVAGKYTMGTAPEISVAKNTVKSIDTLIVEAPLGTSASKLKKDYLSVVYATLDGTTEKETFAVTNWDTDKYRSSTRAEQTITGTIPKTTSDVVEFPSGLSKKATAKVTLYRDSDKDDDNNSSKDDDNRSDSQDFWDDIKDQIEDADKGDKVYADTGSFDKVPTSVLEKLKGKDITLIIERPVGKDIIIKGKNVKTPPSGLIYYSVTELATLYKDGGTASTTSSKASTASSRPSTGGGGGTTSVVTPKPPTSSTAPLSSSSEESSASSSSSSEEEEIISSEEEEDLETDLPIEEPKPEKKKMSPVMAVVIVTAGVAALSGVAALVVLRKRP